MVIDCPGVAPAVSVWADAGKATARHAASATAPSNAARGTGLLPPDGNAMDGLCYFVNGRIIEGRHRIEAADDKTGQGANNQKLSLIHISEPTRPY